jgi:hypothetical protein
MGKARKRSRGLLRVAIASSLMMVALTSVAGASEVACSMDPRDPALMKQGAELCRPGRFTADQVPTGQERANTQHLISDDLNTSPIVVIDRAPEQAPAPAPSDGTQFGLEWALATIALAILASGSAGLIVGRHRGRPQAVSA